MRTELQLGIVYKNRCPSYQTVCVSNHSYDIGERYEFPSNGTSSSGIAHYILT